MAATNDRSGDPVTLGSKKDRWGYSDEDFRIDVGDRRIGVAVSDPTGFIATGLTTIKRQSGDDDVEAVAGFIGVRPGNFVVGPPKNMDGTVGFQAKSFEFIEPSKGSMTEKL